MRYIPRIAKALIVTPLLFSLQGGGVSMKTAVCPIPAATVEHAALYLVVASRVYVLLVTQAFAASMTQMNVLPHPPYVKMKEYASTPLVPTSELFFLNKEISNIWHIYEICDMMITVKTEGNKMHEANLPNSIGVCVLRGLPADTVRAHTSLAHLHRAWMAAPATKSPKQVTRATAFQVGWFEFPSVYNGLSSF